MQSEYHRLQKQHEQEADDHKQINEQRNQEYNQFKQEKVLEVSNLKGNTAQPLYNTMWESQVLLTDGQVVFSPGSPVFVHL